MSLQKERIGTTLTVVWEVLTNGDAVSLDGRDIRVFAIDPHKKRTEMTDLQIGGSAMDVVTCVFEGKEQEHPGIYQLECIENYNKPNQAVLDDDVIMLVPRSKQRTGGSIGLATPTIQLTTGTLWVGVKGKDGKSAYELAVADGYEGTVTEWLASLHGQDADIAAATAATNAANAAAAAANDAAEDAEDATTAANTAASAANTAASSANAGEVVRQQNETQRNTNETNRQNAESQRQQTFQTNEAARQTAYQNAEANRNGAYQEAEEDRDEIFNSKEATRDAANQAALNCADTLAALGPKLSQSGTASGTSIDVKVNGSFKTGYRLCVTATCDNPKMSYILRIHNTDNTFTTIDTNPKSLVLAQDADYIQAVNYTTAIDGAGLTLTVYVNTMADIYKDSQENVPVFKDLLTRVSVYSPEWEFGNINMSVSGWEYGSNLKRVRTKKGTSIHLYAGDKIGLTDYDGYEYYLGWQLPNGTYVVGSGWLQSDFTVQAEGNYVVLIHSNPEAEPNTLAALAGLFFIKSLRSRIEDVGNEIGGKTEMSGTTTAGNYFLNMPYILKVGESVSVEVNVSSVEMTYGVRFTYSDNTYGTAMITNVRGSSIGFGTAEKDVIAIQLYSFNAVASKTATIKCYKGIASTTHTFSQDLSALDKSVGWRIPNDKFEIGSINGSSSGLSYVQSPTRARLCKGVTIHLAVGDIIGLTNYTNKQFYLLGFSGSTFISIGWNTANVEISQEGDYTLIIANQTEVNLTSASVLSDYVFVKRAGSLLAYFENIAGSSTQQPVQKGGVFSVGHRGHCQSLTSPVRPENTMASFKYAKELGYAYIETDIQITSDGEFVLCHDTTIDRTSNGTGTISQMTLAEIRQYKFGYLNGNAIGDYANEQIPTLEEFLVFCHRVGIHAFLELEGQRTQQNCADIIDIIKSCGMYGNVTILSIPRLGNLAHFHTLDETIDLCALQAATDDVIDQTLIDIAVGLKGTKNKVCIGAHTYTSEEVAMCIEAGLPLGIYTINNAQTALALPSYVSFITTDTLDYAKILREAAMA